jgi:hypothetical protein
MGVVSAMEESVVNGRAANMEKGVGVGVVAKRGVGV